MGHFLLNEEAEPVHTFFWATVYSQLQKAQTGISSNEPADRHSERLIAFQEI